jgi:hypothetical protein
LPSYFAKPPNVATLNRSHPLASGLVCAYQFNEKSGNRVYDSARINNGTLSATVSAVPTWVSGPFGSALSFDGSSAYIAAAPASLSTQTFAAWVFVPNRTSVYTILGASASNGLQIRVATDGTISSLQQGIASLGSSATGALATNTWTLISASWNSASSAWAIYVNGLVSGSGTNVSRTITGATPWIGHNGSGTGVKWPGQMACSYFWNRPLTANQQKTLYQDAWAMFRRRYVPTVIFSPPASGSVGTATGTSTASGVGSSAADSIASTSGTGTVSGVGAASSASVASTAGTSSTSGIGAGSAASVASTSGTSTVSGVGSSTTGSSSVGTATGTSTVSGVGVAASTSVASASGTCTVVATGTSAAASVGSASGTSAGSGVGDSSTSGASVGTATGTSTASAVSASAVAAIFSAVGTATAQAYAVGGTSSTSNDTIEFARTVGDALNFDRTIPDALDFTFSIPDSIDF